MPDIAAAVAGAMRHPVLILEQDLRVRVANGAFCDAFGLPRAAVLGHDLFGLDGGRWDIPQLRSLVDAVRDSGIAVEHHRIEHDFGWRGQRVLLVNAARLDREGMVVLAIEDITDIRESERALRASEARLREVLETDAVGVLFFDDSSAVTEANTAFLRMTGYTREEIAERQLTWRRMTPPEWNELSEAQLARFRESGLLGPYEKEYFLKDGDRSWFLIAGRRLSDRSIVVFCLNIDAQKRTEQERKLLAQELSHRVKNTLAVVHALATQTARSASSVEAFREAFGGRLEALSRAHGLLLKSQWQRAELRSLVEETVEAYRVDGSDRVEVEGDPVFVTPRQGLGLALVLHELGTNAAKYGALSRPEGRLRVSWRVEDGADGRRVRLDWRERDGPAVRPPGHRSFGSRLIERACSYELEGGARLDFAPDGLRCSIDFPLD